MTDSEIDLTPDLGADADDGPGEPVSDSGSSDVGRRPYKAIAIATGEAHTCVVLDDNNVKCWGDNSFGELGYGDTLDRGNSPSEMGDALPIVNLGTNRFAIAVSGGRYATCAILDDETIKCWGWAGLSGQSGSENVGANPEDMGDNLTPLDFGGRRAVHVAMGHDTAYASMDDNSLWVWGGLGPMKTPHLLDLGTSPRPVKGLIASAMGVVVVYEDGSVGHETQADVVDLLAAGHKVVSVSGAYGSLTCAIRDDRTSECVSGTALANIDIPVGAAELGVEASGDVCVRFPNGMVQCFGGCDANSYWCVSGQPSVSLGEAAAAITAGGEAFTCALLSSGGVKCWGAITSMIPGPYLGASISYTQANGAISYGTWQSIALGSHL